MVQRSMETLVLCVLLVTLTT